MPLTKITSQVIKDNAVTNAKMADNAIGTAELTDDAVTAVKIDDDGTGFTLGSIVVDTSTLFADATNNRVGINTASPTDTLHVEGGALIKPSSGVGTLIIEGHTDARLVLKSDLGGANGDWWYIKANESDFDLTFINGSTEIMRIDNDKKLGFGGVTPLSTLHTKGSTGMRMESTHQSNAMQLIATGPWGSSNGGDGGLQLNAYDSTGSARVQVTYRRVSSAANGDTVGDYPIEWWTSNADSGLNFRMKLNRTGLGLGTQNPRTKLEVNGNGHFGGNVHVGDSYGNKGIFGSNADIASDPGTMFFSASNVNTSNSAYIKVSSGNTGSDATKGHIDLVAGHYSGSNMAGHLRFWTGANGNQQRLAITDTGVFDFKTNHITNFNTLQSQGTLYLDNSGAIDSRGSGDITFRTTDSLSIRMKILNAGVVEAYGHLKVKSDSHKFCAGLGEDMQMYHNGTDSYLESHTGHLRINNSVDGGTIRFQTDDTSGQGTTPLVLEHNLATFATKVDIATGGVGASSAKLVVGTARHTGSSAIAQFDGFLRFVDSFYISKSSADPTHTVGLKYANNRLEVHSENDGDNNFYASGTIGSGGDVTIGNDLIMDASQGTGRLIIEPTSGTSDFEAIRLKNDTHQVWLSVYRGGTERGRVATAYSDLTLHATNGGGVRVADDSYNGMRIADGGNATFSHDVRIGGTSLTPSGDKDQLVVESTSHGGMSALGPDASEQGFFTGHASSTRVGEFHTRYDTNTMTIGSAKSGMQMLLMTGNRTTALTLDSSQNASFTGDVTITDTGSSSSLTVDGNTGSGNDGVIILKGHTSSNSRAYVYFNNGVTSGGLNWYLGSIRGSNAWGLSCGNDDWNNWDDNVFAVDGNRKMGVGGDPTGAKFTVDAQRDFSSGSNLEVARFQVQTSRPIAMGWIDSGSKMSLYTPANHHLVLAAGPLGSRDIEIDDNGDIYFLGETGAPWDRTSGSGGLWQSGGVFATAMSGGAGSSCYMANKTEAEGHMMDFAIDSSIKGYINVDGETVSLVGFSGQHESETSGKAKSIPKGTVMSSIGTTFKDDHVRTKISDSVGDTAVYGVVSSYASYDTGDDKDVDYRMILNAVGIAEVLVTGKASIGDLIESNGDGSAKVQDDDIIRSKTIGKVTKAKTTTTKGLALCVLYCG